jgi:hypothetical protein
MCCIDLLLLVSTLPADDRLESELPRQRHRPDWIAPPQTLSQLLLISISSEMQKTRLNRRKVEPSKTHPGEKLEEKTGINDDKRVSASRSVRAFVKTCWRDHPPNRITSECSEKAVPCKFEPETYLQSQIHPPTATAGGYGAPFAPSTISHVSGKCEEHRVLTRVTSLSRVWLRSGNIEWSTVLPERERG